jgi:sugar phosphate permease
VLLTLVAKSQPAVTSSDRFAFGEADVPRILLLGTVATVFTKFLCGPVLAALGTKRVGCVSAVAVAAAMLGVGGWGGVPMLSFSAAWIIGKIFMCGTWPGTSTLVAAWFPFSEHGTAWSVMSTASRSGILCVTGAVTMLEATRKSNVQDFGVQTDIGPVKVTDINMDLAIDDGISVMERFRVVAVVLLAWTVAVAFILQDRPQSRAQPPPISQAASGGGGSKSASRASGTEVSGGQGVLAVSRELWATMRQPVFLFAAFVQITVTPIAEFQSQLALFLTKEKLPKSDVSAGVSLWHLGVLGSVLIAGRVFDSASPVRRMALFALPMLLNAVLFLLLLAAPELVAGARASLRRSARVFGFSL